MKVEICIPTYNEEKVIAKTISALLKEFSSRGDIEWLITVSDNGSSDNTKDLLQKMSQQNLKVFLASAKGKGLAIREALLASDAHVFGFVDADLSTHPKSVLDLLQEIENGNDIVIGSRLKDSATVKRGFIRNMFSKAYRMLTALFLKMPDVQDVQCGAKLFSGQGINILKETKEKTWFLDTEVLALAVKRGISVKEIPVQWDEFRYEGRKTKLNVVRDGLFAVIAMIRIRNRINKSM